jgi:hypothetical protein
MNRRTQCWGDLGIQLPSHYFKFPEDSGKLQFRRCCVLGVLKDETIGRVQRNERGVHTEIAKHFLHECPPFQSPAGNRCWLSECFPPTVSKSLLIGERTININWGIVDLIRRKA